MYGFHDSRPDDSFMEHQLQIEASQRSLIRGAWPTDPPEFGLPNDIPVATFMEWDGSLNVGGSLVDCLQISEVTVRTSHRRKGLLRSLMTTSLTEASERGIPVAALTVSEASIYGRFGFGPAVFEDSVVLRTGWDFSLEVPPTGTVEYLNPERLTEATHEVYERFHSMQTGSIGRTAPSHEAYNGSLDKDRKPSKRIRAAGHWNDDGFLDGYVTWQPSKKEGEIDIVDFVPTTEAASLALWAFVASLDLIRRVHLRRGRVDEHLPWTLTDSRRYSVKDRGDLLWLRVLDPVACLTARNYYSDGEVSLRVVDDMGFADGTWRLSVKDGSATMTSVEKADVEIDARALGSALLGGVNVQALATAGQVRGDATAIDELGILLARRRAPWCITPF